MYSNNRILNALAGVLLLMVSFSVLILTLPSTKASDSVVDNVTINVPVSCSMSATGNTSHNATVQNGATVSDIGTTNIKVICNDNSGYAIYAIGYTDDTYGKTVLTSSTLGSTHDVITSSTVTTGTSSWAMKLTSQTGTYAPTIVTDYASYHAVPQEYTKVAYLTASTDTGTNATGSNLTTTYRTYISQTQPAGTYVGQVKYTLVHPSDAGQPGIPVSRQFEITYDAGNYGYFDGDTSVRTNTVVYDVTCESDNKEYYVSHTSNVDDDGNKLSSLNASEYVDDTITIPGASRLKVVVNYDYALDGSPVDPDALFVSFNNNLYGLAGTGTRIFIVEGDTVNIEFSVNDTYVYIDSSKDYGYYARIYQYDEGDEEYHDCTWTRVSGTYEVPDPSGSYWIGGWNWGGQDYYVDLEEEDDLLSTLLPDLMFSNQDQLTVRANWFY